jgi:hypothetical protein
MTLQEFRDILLTADSEASHYESMQKENCTIWTERGKKDVKADNRHFQSIWQIQVDRFTKIEFDPMVDVINSVLDRGDIAFSYSVFHEEETKYIHHVWDCEVAQ